MSLATILDVIVDPEDHWLLEKYGWINNGQGYFQAYVDDKLVYLHRKILDVKNNRFVDHKDGNLLNCRRENLRLCTNSQNQANSKKRKNCTSKYKGVCWNKARNNWLSSICVNQTTIYLGSFYSEVEAAIAYNKAAINYFGEFARLNEIDFYMEEKK